ncbi:hypothetical protein ENKNEFLB_02639 [Nocardioides aquaticus]|uniref:WD40 repeat domain-containing protein n=1 Tax=Nocardioides aquaticus TaxID=160826 RepID=A0ABX8EI98_9ACTN|nr:hypothetical protein [Nocardioides aquaticus]QVT80248.1 hypothetical protein ENKNEFLB_02639 [Nocardioides aquaticus]
MRPTRWRGLALGAACASLVFLPLAVEGARDPGTTAALPHRLADYSYRTGDVSDAPPGRALALYQHGFGVEFLDFPQAVVLAADTDVYRRLDVAEDRAGPETQGDPAPMLLSPDGRRVAIGDHDLSGADIEVVDLSSGEVARHPLPPARSVRPIAWSADSSQVAYLARDDATDPYSGRALVGDLFVLHADSGEVTPMAVGDEVSVAAFSPDGLQLAVQRHGRDPGIAILELASATTRNLPQPTSPTRSEQRRDAGILRSQGGQLAGPDAWSPDGQLLAIRQDDELAFRDLGAPAQSSPRTLSVQWPYGQALVGWTGEREVALLQTHDDDTTRLLAYALDGGEVRELTRVEGTSSYGVQTFQLASALLSDLEVRPAGDPDRGPMPTLLRITLALLLGLVVAALTARLPRRPPGG